MKALHTLLLALLPFSVSAGQLSSDFQGRVVNSYGQPVAGAVLVLENLQTGHITRHVSGDTGRWKALGKRSDGAYRVSCYAPGAVVPAVRFEGRVQLGQTHRRNCVLGAVDAHSPKWLTSWQWRQGEGDRHVL